MIQTKVNSLVPTQSVYEERRMGWVGSTYPAEIQVSRVLGLFLNTNSESKGTSLGPSMISSFIEQSGRHVNPGRRDTANS